MKGRGRGSSTKVAPPSVANNPAPFASAASGNKHSLPAIQSQPPPTFPKIERFPPHPSYDFTEQELSLLEIDEDFCKEMRESPYYFHPQKQRGDTLQRYSDRYVEEDLELSGQARIDKIPYHISSLPSIMVEWLGISSDIVAKKEKKAKRSKVDPDKLEKDEKETKEEDKEKEDEDEDEEGEGNASYEEEDEDDNDYNLNYFDPGDEYLDEEGGDDEPVF